MERRDSAQSDTRRSSDGSVSSQPTHPSILPPPAFNRPELFHSLRPMASTESLNVSLTSKPYYCDRNCQKSDWKTHRNVCEPITQTYSAPATPNFSNPASPTTEN
ncbi:zf-MYND domain containing protein [Pyrenophora tritici-repentis]|nr:zf-MYND domain containing protein [Pyrenophora tritici-repentis]